MEKLSTIVVGNLRLPLPPNSFDLHQTRLNLGLTPHLHFLEGEPIYWLHKSTKRVNISCPYNRDDEMLPSRSRGLVKA